MRPQYSLPIDPSFIDSEEYVEKLLAFVTETPLFQTLCGGVHILDFMTKKPDLYETIIPEDWRHYFETQDLNAILDSILNERIRHDEPTAASGPPSSLVSYINSIRRLSLDRSFSKDNDDAKASPSLPRHVVVGMKPKKVHEVENFAKYIDGFLSDLAGIHALSLSHVVDFGAGQNYLGRALASPRYGLHVVALESKAHNIDGARSMDITARLAEKKRTLRNKKLHRNGIDETSLLNDSGACETTLIEHDSNDIHAESMVVDPQARNGSIQHVETRIASGDLSNVIKQIPGHGPAEAERSGLLVVSLHSCGNLLHHGLRSLVANDAVKAVAMIGCCYNLVTERLGPPTFKTPSLRSANLRLDQTSAACDPDGFPLSERLMNCDNPHIDARGIRLNITARMMACQAPQNWTKADCEAFFTRHYYRALLQRIFLDYGILESSAQDLQTQHGGGSPRGWSGAGPPITIGSLRKSCYLSFPAYVRGAIDKMTSDVTYGARMADCARRLTDDDILDYESRFAAKKKHLSIVWTLMAFSAAVIESVIVVDRWLYLKEQAEVADCWVETVFDYAQSPRNLVIVGIKKQQRPNL